MLNTLISYTLFYTDNNHDNHTRKNFTAHSASLAQNQINQLSKH
jgi:hypothetical protein